MGAIRNRWTSTVDSVHRLVRRLVAPIAPDYVALVGLCSLPI